MSLSVIIVDNDTAILFITVCLLCWSFSACKDLQCHHQFEETVNCEERYKCQGSCTEKTSKQKHDWQAFLFLLFKNTSSPHASGR